MEKFIGLAASILSMIAFMPQAIYVIKTKDTTSLSLSMYIIFVLSVFLWLVYGFIIDDTAIIVANIVCLFFSAIILVVKIMNYKEDNGNKEKYELKV